MLSMKVPRVSEEDVGSLDYMETPCSGPRGQVALGFPEKHMLIRNNRDNQQVTLVE